MRAVMRPAAVSSSPRALLAITVGLVTLVPALVLGGQRAGVLPLVWPWPKDCQFD